MPSAVNLIFMGSKTNWKGVKSKTKLAAKAAGGTSHRVDHTGVCNGRISDVLMVKYSTLGLFKTPRFLKFSMSPFIGFPDQIRVKWHF